MLQMYMYNFFLVGLLLKTRSLKFKGLKLEYTLNLRQSYVCNKQNIKLDLIFYSTILKVVLKVVAPINELIFDFLV